MPEELVFNTSRAEEAAAFGPSNGRRIAVTTAVVDTEVTVEHGLTDASGAPRVPRGYFVIGQDKAGTVYDSTNPHTDTLLKIRCDVATVALKLWVF